MDFIDKTRRWFAASSMPVRLMAVNAGVFVVLTAALLLGAGAGNALALWTVELPSEPSELLMRPWTLLTYMFAHRGVGHLLFNMLWLYWLGTIFLEYFTPKQLVGLYVLGGLGGAVLFVAAYNLLPFLAGEDKYLIGASASVLAIVVGISAYAPNYRVNLLLWGGVSLKWIAIATIGLDFLNLGTGAAQGNIGGHLAHVGGMAVGLCFAMGMRSGHDMTAVVNKVIDAVASLSARKRGGVGQPMGGRAYTYGENRSSAPKQDGPTEEEIDRILVKLKVSGFAALSDEEKNTLFGASRKRKQ